MNVLHITVHMGGGVGKAIAGLAISSNQIEGERHRILLLEQPQKLHYIEECKKNGTEVVICKELQEAEPYLKEADILVLNWWQHPVMAKFLAEFPNLLCRMVLWSHVNGCVYPYLPYPLLEQMDLTFFTTAYSLENPNWTRQQAEEVERKSCIVSGMGDFVPASIIPKANYQSQNLFVIGYIGTLNYAKLHSDYFLYCQKVIEQNPNVRFLMVGDYETALVEHVRELGLEKYFQFVGFAEDVYQYMEQMDVMGYLLSENNYATTENVLIEAMAFALPIVALNNKPEQYIITSEKNGFLVRDAQEYVKQIKKLEQSQQLREKIGKQARESVIEQYSMERNRKIFLQGLYQVMQKEKKRRNLAAVYGKTPYDWFVSCTGKEKEIFLSCVPENIENTKKLEEFLQICNPTYKELSKSSISHFASYFPEDPILAYFNKKVKEIKNRTPGGKRTPLYQVLPLSMPYLIQIFPVYACNFHCGYCIHSLDRSKHGYLSDKIFMDLELFQKIVEDIKVSGQKIKMLRFAAIGEPLLHKEIAKMVAYAKKAEIAESIDIVTNASLLTKELADELVEAGLTKFRISLEGVSEKDYKNYAEADISFNQFVENIRYLYQHCKETKVYIKIIDYMVQSPKKQERFYQIFRPICHSIAIEHLTPTIQEIDYSGLSGIEEWKKPQNGETLFQSRICSQPFYMMQINPDGKVVPCCSMKYPAVLGDVCQEQVQKIWLGERFQKFRKAMLTGVEKASDVCRDCSLYLYDMHEEDRLDEAAEELLKRYEDMFI